MQATVTMIPSTVINTYWSTAGGMNSRRYLLSEQTHR